MPTEKERSDRELRYARVLTILVSILVIANLAIEATLLLRY